MLKRIYLAFRQYNFFQSTANKYYLPGWKVSERAYWLWRDFLCEVRGHSKRLTEQGWCKCCYRTITRAVNHDR